MITWEEKYATGVAELDKQHQHLFSYTNNLEDIIKSPSVSKQTIDGILTFLETYIKVHFNHEESCMFKHQCPIANKNKEAHDRFIEHFKATESKIIKDGATDEILKELHHFLETWLVEHICKIDTHLKTCVK